MQKIPDRAGVGQLQPTGQIQPTDLGLNLGLQTENDFYIFKEL